MFLPLPKNKNVMKTLSIQQPWASLICAGIKDVENRTWKAAELPGRILIHASSKKVSRNFLDEIPLDWMIGVNGAVLYGNIPPLKDLPTSSIIGYVTVKEFADITDSLWDGGEGAIKWVLEDAYLFDEPIPNINGKLHLFEYDVDENNLPPAHKVELRYPQRNGDELILPCDDEVIDQLNSDGAEIDVDLDEYVAQAILSEDGTLLAPKTIRMAAPERSLVFDVKEPGLYSHDNPETGEPIMEKNAYDEDIYWEFFAATISNPRIE